MKIEKVKDGLIVTDERVNLVFRGKTMEEVENELLRSGYHKGFVDDMWILPGDIIPGAE